MKDFFAAKQLIGLGRVESIALSPDESWAAVAVERLNRESGKYVSDIWRVPTDGSTAPTQLTRGESRDTWGMRRVHAKNFMPERRGV